MSQHAKPRHRPKAVRLASFAARHPVRTLRHGQGRAIDRIGCGLGLLVLCIGPATAVAVWVLTLLAHTL